MEPLPTVMDAYYRRSGEDRATEILATVLQRAPVMLRELAAVLQLAPPYGYVVQTQVGRDSIIDLEVQAHGRNGRPCWLLWSEHKVADPLTVEQLTKEASALQLKAGTLPRKLLAVTLYQPPATVREHAELADVTLLRWRDLVEMARRTLNALNGEIHASGGPAAEAVERQLLLEWCAFSENELEAPVEPLTQHRVDILPEADKAVETLEHLVEIAFREATAALGIAAPKVVGEEWHAGAPAGTWLADLGCKLYAGYDLDDSWTVGGTGQPIFATGMWADGDEAEGIRKQIELRQRLAELRFSCWDEPGKRGWISFARTLPLAEVTKIEDLEGQERAVQEFCAQALRQLLAAGVSEDAR